MFKFADRRLQPDVYQSQIIGVISAIPIIAVTLLLFVFKSLPRCADPIIKTSIWLSLFAPLVPLLRACSLNAQRSTRPGRSMLYAFLLFWGLSFVIAAPLAIIGVFILSPSTAEGGQQVGGAFALCFGWGLVVSGYGVASWQLRRAHRAR
jgi:hypothetical protein